MRRLAAALLVAAATGAWACARPEAPEAGAQGVLEADALKLLTRYDAAWAAKGVAAVDRMVAPDYVYFSSKGRVEGRDQMRAMLASPGYRIDRSTRDDVHAYRLGSTVVIGSHWTGAGTFEGQPFTDDQRCSVVIAFAGGAGRVLSEHCTNIPPGAGPVPANAP